jgi:hypothetical protein
MLTMAVLIVVMLTILLQAMVMLTVVMVTLIMLTMVLLNVIMLCRYADRRGAVHNDRSNLRLEIDELFSLE